MSVAFAAHRQRGKGDISPAAIQKLLDENNHLIQCIMDFQSKGKTVECSQYQQMLHRNLVYLATIADSNQNMQSLLPAPPTQNMPMVPGGMSQSGPPQPPHGHSLPSEGMVSGGPPTSHMQSQMNGQMPGQLPMQGPGPGQPPTMPGNSMNMPPSSHGSMGGYNHAAPSSQGMPTQSQMSMVQGQPMGNYGPRPNINMQPNQASMIHQQAPPSQQYNMPPGGGQHYPAMMGQGNHVMGQRSIPPYRPPQQGPPQQYPGQEDYYGEQYSHSGQGTPEGHSDYGFQQPSYPEQGYDKPYEDSSQHYYEGGNPQYGQPQEAYQQGPPQQQVYPQQQQQQQQQQQPQQQYSGQQPYPSQQPTYGPSQGAPGQYPNYTPGQGQQYAGYRPPQPGPPQSQQQRSYGYDQGQYGNYQQ